MRKKIPVLIVTAFLLTLASPASEAALPTFDAVNAALNEIRNALMQSQFAQDIALAIERVNQLKAQYLELLRFHAGLDDFFEVFVGDPLKEIFGRGTTALRDAFVDFGWITPQIEILGNGSGPHDIRASLEAITGQIPDSRERPYIPFEEMQIIDGFQLAQEIRRSGERTREAVRLISQQAKSASPKGAARLQAEATSEVMVLSQQNQEAMAKLLELEATQIEQVSREEKRLERERLKYMEDAAGYLQTLLAGRGTS
jgi:hypothetical protein